MSPIMYNSTIGSDDGMELGGGGVLWGVLTLGKHSQTTVSRKRAVGGAESGKVG